MARWPVKVSWFYEHTHRGARCVKAGTARMAVTDTKAAGLALVAAEIERLREWVLDRSPNTKTVITIELDADGPEATTPATPERGGDEGSQSRSAPMTREEIRTAAAKRIAARQAPDAAEVVVPRDLAERLAAWLVGFDGDACEYPAPDDTPLAIRRSPAKSNLTVADLRKLAAIIQAAEQEGRA